MGSIKQRITPKLLIKIFCILPILSHLITLVNAIGLDDDSLETALEAIERRQRDLQIREDYGQPENIGYGFQKNMGFFEPGPSHHLGASRESDDWGFVAAPAEDYGTNKRERSYFRQPTVQPTDGLEYLEALKGLWDKYQQQNSQALDLENLSDEDVAEMLAALESENDIYRDQRRERRNYRVFENQKRSPSFGQGLYGKRNAQRLSYETPPSDAFLYSLKWVNPAMNREGVEGLRASESYNDDRDKDILSVLNRPRYNNEAVWMTAPVDTEVVETDKQRFAGPGPYWSRDRKRAPVKRNANRVRKETTDEVKGIFSAESKKQNSADSSEVKKVVRRAEPNRPGEISDLFRVQKKNIDWSKHFGVNKRMYSNPFDTRVFNTKRNLADNLNAVENRIGGVEEQILADAVKYTGANSDRGLDEVRPELVRRLEAAYSLEKMRAALEDFKNSVSSSATEAPFSSTTVGKDGEGDKAKRIAIKKEGVSPDNEAEFINWQRTADAAPAPDGACPLLEQLVDNCVRMEEMLGKFAEMLTPACTLHQICYSCGSEFGFARRSSCDLMFLSEARHLCQDKPECLGGARETVVALREVHARATPAATCRANPCVADHFLTSPSGIVSLSLP